MSILSSKKTFGDFLSVALGSKEVALVIAKNKTELLSLAKAMDKQGFKRSENILEIFSAFGGKSHKTYFVAYEKMDKDIYDFIVQYPTGQVEIFDKKLMKSQIFFPDYKNFAVVLLVDKDDLNKIQKKGFNLLSVTGSAYQS